MAQKKLPRWDFLHSLFWGYSTLLLFILVLSLLIPINSSSSDSENTVIFLLSYGPVLGFLISIFVERKQYVWTWGRKILHWYSFLFFGLSVVLEMVGGTTGSQMSSLSTSYTSEIGIVASLLLCPILIYFVLLGNERFE